MFILDILFNTMFKDKKTGYSSFEEMLFGEFESDNENDKKTIFNYLKSYLQHDLKREISSWMKLFKFYLPLTILILIITFCGFIYIKPFSTQETYLAIGQDGSISSEMGKSFVTFFNILD